MASRKKATPECVSCGHAEAHSSAGIGVCAATGCGCDGPVEATDSTPSFAQRKQRGRKQPQAVRFVNASRKRVYVAEGDGRRKLPRVAPPDVIHAPKGIQQGAFCDGDARIDLVEGYEAFAVVRDLPPRVPGTLYVVEPEALTLFPHREDFVVAALFSVTMGSRQRRRKDGTRKRPKWVMSGVARNTLPPATERTPSLAEWMRRAALKEA